MKLKMNSMGDFLRAYLILRAPTHERMMASSHSFVKLCLLIEDYPLHEYHCDY